jgi:hypothetical protein
MSGMVKRRSALLEGNISATGYSDRVSWLRITAMYFNASTTPKFAGQVSSCRHQACCVSNDCGRSKDLPDPAL